VTQERNEVREWFRAYHEDADRAARERLVEAHIGLAAGLARRFEGRGEPVDDLIQVASLGLLKAIERFDVDRGFEFSTFAVPTILGELKRHFRDSGWAMRVPRRVQELRLATTTAIADLTQELGRSPSIPEIARRVGGSTEEVIEALDAGQAYRGDSLDAPQSAVDEEGGSLAARIGAIDPALDRLEDDHEMRRLLDKLPDRQRAIVVMRFFGGLTQAEIAERIGVSQMHVSRLLARSLDELRRTAARNAQRDPGAD